MSFKLRIHKLRLEGASVEIGLMTLSFLIFPLSAGYCISASSMQISLLQGVNSIAVDNHQKLFRKVYIYKLDLTVLVTNGTNEGIVSDRYV